MGHGEDEPILEAAKRELKEETGLASNTWLDLGVIYEANGIGEIEGNIFLAKNVAKVGNPLQMDDECITEIIMLSISEIKKLITSNTITDSPTIAALAKADYMNLFKQ